MTFAEWCARHNVSPQAVAELLTVDGEPDRGELCGYASEASVQRATQIRAAEIGGRLWRNNSGAGKLEDGSFVRWGLCNESKAMNGACKSADLIGLLPMLIRPADVGRTVALFSAAECKAPGWSYKGTPRETAQAAFLALVRRLGGVGMFVTDPSQLTIL